MLDCDLTIRRYVDDDHECVKKLHVEALEASNSNNPGPWDSDLDDISATYLRKKGEFLVGEINGRVIAMGAIKRIDSALGEIKRMRVQPNLQRRGIGSAILAALETRAAELGISCLRLDTTEHQRSATAFYVKHGYSEAGRRNCDGLTVIWFTKELSDSS